MVKKKNKKVLKDVDMGEADRLAGNLETASTAIRDVVDDWRQIQREDAIALEPLAVQRILKTAQVIQGQAAYLVSVAQRKVNDQAVKKKEVKR